MQYLSQRDARWSEKKLGASNLTVGRYGCTTTCISMLSDYFGCFKDPGKISEMRDWYTADGLVLWNKLDFKKMKFMKRLQGRNDSAILASLKMKDYGCIIQVDNGQHWILPIRKTWFSNDYICVDPWTGKTCAAVSDYKNITGSAHFFRK